MSEQGPSIRTKGKIAVLTLAASVVLAAVGVSTASAAGEPAPPVLPAPAGGATPPLGGPVGLAPAPRRGHSRPVCTQHGAHCTALVATDAAGVLLVAATPTAVSL